MNISTQQKHKKNNINCKINLLLLVIIVVLLGIVSTSTKTDPPISTTNPVFCHIHPTPTVSTDAGTEPWNQKGPLWNACLSYPASIDTCRGENRDIVDSQILDKLIYIHIIILTVYLYIYKYVSSFMKCAYIKMNIYIYNIDV